MLSFVLLLFVTATWGMYMDITNPGLGCLHEPWYSHGSVGYHRCAEICVQRGCKTFSMPQASDKCYTSPKKGYASGAGCGVFNMDYTKQEKIYVMRDHGKAVGEEKAVGMYMDITNPGLGCLHEPWYSHGSVGYHRCAEICVQRGCKTFSMPQASDKCYTSPKKGYASGAGCGVFNMDYTKQEKIYVMRDHGKAVGEEKAVGLPADDLAFATVPPRTSTKDVVTYGFAALGVSVLAYGAFRHYASTSKSDYTAVDMA